MTDYFAVEPEEMRPVTSTNIAAIGWTAVDNDLGTLQVSFRSGGVYRYAAVPRSHYEALIAPETSVGKTFAALIREGRFQAMQIRHALRVSPPKAES